MVDNFAIEQKIIARKNIAKYSRLLKKATISIRLSIIKAIATERGILDFKVNKDNLDNFKNLVYNIRRAEMAIELPGAPAQNNQVMPLHKVNIGQFINALEQDLKTEEQQIGSKLAPTQNDLIRWARKQAFLQYYKSMNIGPDQPIAKNDGDDKTLRQLSPNKETIYKLYLDRLEELRRRTDKYRLEDSEFNDAMYGGIPQGGSFEKWLERHREDMMNSVYANR